MLGRFKTREWMDELRDVPEGDIRYKTIIVEVVERRMVSSTDWSSYFNHFDEWLWRVDLAKKGWNVLNTAEIRYMVGKTRMIALRMISEVNSRPNIPDDNVEEENSIRSMNAEPINKWIRQRRPRRLGTIDESNNLIWFRITERQCKEGW